jgi:Superinfection immunity protein
MTEPLTSALLTLAATLLVLLYCLPTCLALGRDIVARTQVVVLNLALGWTGVAWVCALVLACGPRRPRPGTPPPTRPLPHPPGASSVYRDGVYLVSSGDDANTWAIRDRGTWRIVYEMDGEERLVGVVPESDVPLSVLASALGASDRAP